MLLETHTFLLTFSCPDINFLRWICITQIDQIDPTGSQYSGGDTAGITKTTTVVTDSMTQNQHIQLIRHAVASLTALDYLGRGTKDLIL